MTEDLADRLLGWLAEQTEGRICAAPQNRGGNLRDLGLDSMGLLSFLVLIGERIGIEWDENTPADTFVSIDSISEFLQANFLSAVQP